MISLDRGRDRDSRESGNGRSWEGLYHNSYFLFCELNEGACFNLSF